MKRKLAAILASVMVLTLGATTVFASGSIDTSATTATNAYNTVTGSSATASYTGTDSVTSSYSEEDDSYYLTVSDSAAESLGLVEGQVYVIDLDGNGTYVSATYSDGAFVVSSDDASAYDVTIDEDADYEIIVYAVEEDSESGSEESNLEALETLVAEADDLVESDYTSDSWEAYQEALLAAEEVLADEDATDEDIAEALAALQEAADALELAAETGSETESESESESASETGTGDGSGSGSGTSTSPKTGAAATLPILAVAALAGVVVCGKKVKF